MKTKEYVASHTDENSNPILTCNTTDYKIYDILGILNEKYPNDSFYWRPKLLVTENYYSRFPDLEIRYAFYFKK